MKEQPAGELKRELGVFDIMVSVMNVTIGGGIFLLPALIAVILGNGSLLAYLLCGGMFLLVSLCFAEVGSRISDSGGAYIYLQKAFGPFIGFVSNATFWFAYGSLVVAAVVNGIADMLSVPFPQFEQLGVRAIFFIVLIGGVGLVNIRGVKQGMIAVKFFTFVKLIPLIAIIILGLFALKADNVSTVTFPSFSKLGEASLILFFAFAGGETALNVSGEMKNPNRTGPLGLVLGVASVVIFYCLIHLVSQGVLGDSLQAHTKAPLAAVAQALVGKWGFTALMACAIASIMGSCNSLIMLFPRVMYAGAKQGFLPAFIGRVHPKFATPHWAIASFCVICFVIAISGGFKQLIILATISTLLLFLGVCFALIKFRLRPGTAGPAKFMIPGGILIPVITIAVLTWFLFQSKLEEFGAMAVFVAVVSVIYFVQKAMKSRKKS